MNKLEEARSIINEIDKSIVELFEKRIEVVNEVIEYKKENSLPIEDSNREEELLNKNLGYLKNKELTPYYTKLQKCMFEISKEYQSKK